MKGLVGFLFYDLFGVGFSVSDRKMKRLKSSDDISSYGDKGPSKDWGRRDEDVNLHRSLSSRNVYYKSDNGKKGLSSSSSRYDRLDDDRENSRSVRKRTDYDVEGYDRRKGYDRYRDGGERGIVSSSPRGGYSGDRIHRSESFSVPRREFPKGFRSERDRSRREGSVSSWRRFGGAKDVDENGSRSGHDFARGSRLTSDDTGRVKSPGGSLGEMGRPSSWQSVRTPDHPQGLRDTKSPSCSRTARSPSCSRTTARSPSCSKNAKSSSCSKNAKSPPRSKDSGSEHSKSIEVKKSEDLPVESGNNSEMEEGELEPDPEPVPVVEQLAEEEAANGLKPNPEEFSNDNLVKAKSSEDRDLLPEAKLQPSQGTLHKDKTETQVPEDTHNVVENVDNLSGSSNTSVHETINDEVANGTTEVVKVANDQQCALENSMSAEKASKTVKGSCPSNYEQKDNKGLDLEVKTENIDFPVMIEGSGDKNVTSKVVLSLLDDRIDQSFKDKGKSLAIMPSTDSLDDVIRAEAESLKEGPSPRGFQLFFVDPVKKASIAEKSSSSKLKDEQITTEPLELSLSLPSVLYANNSENPVQATSSQNTVQAPSSPSHARSVQSFSSSFRTSSDAYTASLSFSGSQTFTHNPSCSLTNNSYDNCEKSVGSRPIFKGLDQVTPVAWQGQSSIETENKEKPMYQRILSNGNGLAHHSQMSQDIIIGRVVHLQHQAEEGSSKLPRGLDRQLSHNKPAGVQLMHPTEVRSPTQSIVSHGTGPDYWNEKRQFTRDKVAGDVQDEKQSFLGSGADFMEPIISMIISEPIHTAARKFNEMTRQAASRLKESIRDVILNPGKRSKLLDLQKALERRSDITLEILLQSHRAQLEVLVALKTGLQDFLQQNYEIASSDLAEIFLNLRCRNLTCRSPLPVDECDCRICVQKNGFCSACMCLVCSKFDMASNTCSWVGCDVCLHWCHADCGLRESYIRNGHSASKAQGTTEMQFHCVACRHPSEMFGFVKEVFQNFAKEWTAETLSKELNYVRKIFRASEDARGRQMHELATQMLTRLANKSDVQEVRSGIMALLARNDSSKSSCLIVPEYETIKKKQEEGTSIIAGSSQEPTWLKAVHSDKAPQLERPVSLLPSFDFETNEKNVGSSDLLRHARKESGFDELESIVRIKQAEANMFQSRADDARREAEGLKRIANAKNEKVEEEYTGRIRKLQLIEAEEIRRQKFVELQALEREHQEYFNMKTRMKTEIKDLLLKMEATKCNFTL